MLSFEFTDINDIKLNITEVISVAVNIEEDVPADDMVAVFPNFECGELKEVVVYDDDTVIFSGIVDEQHKIKNADGEYIRITARSLIALLLDNESMPVCYTNPSANLIMTRHLAPFSLKLKGEGEKAYFGTQVVYKGDSNYKVVQDFSKYVYGKNPRINSSRELCFDTESDRTVLFSDNGEGINYYSYQENIRRCDELSMVRIKLLGNTGYDSVEKNEDAIKRGIIRQRYLDAVDTDTPASLSKSMIRSCRKKAYALTLLCMGRYLDILMCDAVVKDSVYNEIDKLYVSAVHYRLSTKGDYTEIVLKRKDV